MIKLTAKPYLQVYSDRNCPGQEDLLRLREMGDVATVRALGDPLNGAEHSGDRCVGRDGRPESMNTFPSPIYEAAGFDPVRMQFSPAGPTYRATGDPNSADIGQGVLERFNGVRFMLQAAVELAVSPNLSLWGLIEGAPGQKERQSFTDKFNRIFPIQETVIYGRAGLTMKF
jgi:hypothetical protein